MDAPLMPRVAIGAAYLSTPPTLTFRSVADDSRYLAAHIWHRQADANGANAGPMTLSDWLHLTQRNA